MLIIELDLKNSLRYIDISMSPEADALAAAVAAAAEIAMNSNMFIDEEKERKEVSSDMAGNVTHGNENTTSGEVEVDAEKRLARSRERNREHARRTRLRKKAQMETLQVRVTELQEEGRGLKQSVEDCSIASILVGLSSGNQQAPTTSLFDAPPKLQQETPPKLVKSGKRKRFVVDLQVEAKPLKLDIEGQTTLIGAGKTHINWKSGVYCDDSGSQRQLTQEQLESLRRERNRMHAKMTRDRKKCFISAIEKTIESLETENKRMRDVLHKVASLSGEVPNEVTPMATPQFTSVQPRTLSVTPEPCEQGNIVFNLSTA